MQQETTVNHSRVNSRKSGTHDQIYSSWFPCPKWCGFFCLQGRSITTCQGGGNLMGEREDVPEIEPSNVLWSNKEDPPKYVPDSFGNHSHSRNFRFLLLLFSAVRFAPFILRTVWRNRRLSPARSSSNFWHCSWPLESVWSRDVLVSSVVAFLDAIFRRSSDV